MTERCEGITASGEQCRCWAVQRINEVPYCLQHGEKELRAIAGQESTKDGLPGESRPPVKENGE